MDYKDTFKGLLKSTGRKGIDALIAYMDASGFYEAPCSTHYHLCHLGGLAEHSWNVYRHMSGLAETIQNISRIDFSSDFDEASIIITALLHDIGKADYRGKPYYIPNYLTNGKISEKKPFESNPDRLYIPHEIASVLIVKQFIELTDEEEFAILYHNNLYTASGRDINGKERPLQLLLHFADLWCSRFVEAEKEA